MTTVNLNTAPYFEDFDPSKDFQQILFKPGTAVQARELTQSQSILRNQIKNFGDSIYQQGSVVIPGNSYGDLSAQNIKVQSLYSGQNLILANFLGKTIIGVTSGVKAVVKFISPATSTDPIVFFLSYVSGGVIGGVANGKLVFDDAEEIYVIGATTTRATLATTSAAGVGSLANVNAGVYYVNGTFVNVSAQTVVMDKFSTTPSVHVLLQIVNEIIDSSEDSSLLDPAQGSYNYAAPGADRLKISLVLTVLPLVAAISEDYVEIMRYDTGVLLEHSQYPKYSELEKSLARRTFDEAGDFVVRGLVNTIREEFKSNNNGGYSLTGSRDNFVATITAGKAYISGFEVRKLSSSALVLNKGRTSDHIKTKNISVRPSFGQYLLVSNIAGTISVRNRETVTLYNSNLASDGTAVAVGTAKVTAINYYLGDTIAGALYQLWVSDLVFTGSNTIDNVGGIRYTNGSAYVVSKYNIPISSGSFAVNDVLTLNTTARQAKVAFWDSINGDVYAYKNSSSIPAPRIGDRLVGPNASGVVTKKDSVTSVGQSSLLFPLPVDSTNSLKTVGGTYDTQYRVIKEMLITTSSGGAGSVTISDGVIEIIDVGSFMAVGVSGIVQNSLFSLNSSGNTLSVAGAGASTTIKVYALVTKSLAAPKTKTLTTNSETFSSASTFTFSKCDVISIQSIVDSVGDITTNFDLDTGQTDYAYNRSRAVLKYGRSLPVGTVTVNYTYYQHSLGGDFFSVDSFIGTPNYLSNIQNYVSPATGITYQLKNYIDFRPSVGSDGTFSSGSAVLNDQIFESSLFTSTVQYFVPRIDLITIDKSGVVAAVRGVPAEIPVTPSTGDGKLALYTLYVPAYTESIVDIKFKRLAIDRYTMKDINILDNRVKNLEEFSTLSASESSVTTLDIVDANTGLTRFKTGYLVENFKTPYVIGDYNNSDYRVFLENQTISAGREMLICDAILTTNSSNYSNSNGYLMLPYTEVQFASQPLSSRVTNINPFSIISWNGTIAVTPPGDSWVEVTQLPDILKSQNVTNVITFWLPAPTPAPSPAPVAAPAPSVQSFLPFAVAPSMPIVVTPAPVPPVVVSVVAPAVVVVTPAPAPVPVVPVSPPEFLMEPTFPEPGDSSGE